MATIANLDINLGARVAGFEKGMKSAQGAIGKLQQTASGASSKLAGIAKGMAVAAGAALASKFSFDAIANSMQELDNLAKTSDTLGIATEDMAALNLAADLAGVSSETLGKAIFKSGLTLQQFADKADELSKIGDAQKRNAIATELFGKQARELTPLLMAGGDAIREAQADMKLFGGAFSRLDLGKVEAANDSITRLQTLFKAVTDTIAVKLAPVITGVVNWFIDASTEGMKFGEIIEASMDLVAHSIAGAANAWAVWGAPIKLVGAAVLELVSLITGALSKLNDASKAIVGKGFDKNNTAAKISAATDKLARDLGRNAVDNFVKGVTLETYGDVMRAIDKAAAAGIENRGFGTLDMMDIEEKSKGRAIKGGPAGKKDARDEAKRTDVRPGALEFGSAAAASAVQQGGGGLMKLIGVAELQLKALDKQTAMLIRDWRERDKGDVLRVARLERA